MSERPVLSICIPNYNMSQWIGNAIDSALAVTPHESVEVVVADNASTDDSLKVLEAYVDNRRVRVLEFTDHVGIADNWNRAVRESSGEWCLVLSADDEVFPAFLSNLDSVARSNPDVAAVSQRAEIVGMEKEGFRTFGSPVGRRYTRSGPLHELIPGNPFPLCSTAFKRSAFDDVGGFATVSEWYDYHFFLRCIFDLGRDIVSVGKIGARYYVKRGSTAFSSFLDGDDLRLTMALLDDLAPVIGAERRLEINRALVAGALGSMPTRVRMYGPRSARRMATSVLGRASRTERIRIQFWSLIIVCGAWHFIFPLREALWWARKRAALRTRLRHVLARTRRGIGAETVR